jgi:proton-dependent oligopeptide transporter, POT family
MDQPPPSPGAGDRDDVAFFGHPRGLATLFFTEMWERFSFYGMKAFLIFYMTADVAKGGLGFGLAGAGIVFGTYTASVYVMSLPGGWLADRYLGLRRAVLYGGVLIMFGHIALALPVEGGFYVGLALVVLGTGLLKPNISALVGLLYGPQDLRRDAGYSIYYMGINVGAFAAPIACGYLAQDEGFRAWLGDSVGIDPNWSWHLGFAAAAIGMFFGLVQYVLGTRHLRGAGERPTPASDAAEARRNRQILAGILLGIPAVVVGFWGLYQAGLISDGEDLGIFVGGLLAVVSVTLFTSLYVVGCRSAEERRQLTVILVLFVGAVIFWGSFEQAASVLNLFALEFTRLEIVGWAFPASWLQSANALFIIALAPIFAILWVALAKRRAEPSSPAKFGLGLVGAGLGFAVMIPAAILIDRGEGPVSPGWLLGLYFLHTCAELALSPVGLSSMSKLAPARWGGLVMGIWFLASANGNFLAGRAVGVSEGMSKAGFFTMMVLVPVAAGGLLFLAVGPIRRMLARNEGGGAGT